MDNIQLLVAVGLPCFLIVVNIWATRHVEARIDRLDGRIDTLTKSVADNQVQNAKDAAALQTEMAKFRVEVTEKLHA
jgi:NAD+--asparagine ADP-ribosyltransferase